ncbi:MAG: alpha-isopropylmalate synthase regulatory domain-containing protein [Prevotella sp.]|uniref:alpha-isopropylmalate synthase regulatory domain-containing protein n=1 Tax=Prevotella sp. AGR2160 TaxID=1280674 RepID=UPI00041281B4|nr:alpha-isopropylmalate synthase regulatory domain-containing protein [Prevotella sp. AGR2160]MDD5861304.1 alpha-isopropylmalate synthase regulatory domain-containing protein [Prevotella sp.]
MTNNDNVRRVEIMDCTLRDGEQTNGVSFLPHEKLMIARMLLHDVGVDRIEVASARVSEGEKDAVRMICKSAESDGMLSRVEVLGFVDGMKSVDWIRECGCQCINLLAKGSLRHCSQQLKKTPAEHIHDIREVIAYAQKVGMRVNLYLEDWSGGMKDSPEYVWQMMDGLKDEPIERFLLPDTLGVLNPMQVADYIGQMVTRYPSCRFDFHGHNDYDMAVADSLAAAQAGASGLHVTVNGLGERCGNAPLSSVQVMLHDMLHIQTNIDETTLVDVSHLVEGYSGIAVAPNTPVIGDYVFTQVAGVHADGDNKGNLYSNDLKPERFGRHREYALGKNSGKANIIKNLKEFGLELTKEQTKAVTKRITELGDRKELVTPDDLPYIVSDVLKHNAPEDEVKLVSYMVSTSYGLRPLASLKVNIKGKEYEADSTGDGQYDAFVKALRKIYKEKLHRTFPLLDNYAVSIPPGGHTDALVQTVITWRRDDGSLIRTRGLDADQTEAAIKATLKMLNIIEQPREPERVSPRNVVF